MRSAWRSSLRQPFDPFGNTLQGRALALRPRLSSGLLLSRNHAGDWFAAGSGGRRLPPVPYEYRPQTLQLESLDSRVSGIASECRREAGRIQRSDGAAGQTTAGRAAKPAPGNRSGASRWRRCGPVRDRARAERRGPVALRGTRAAAQRRNSTHRRPAGRSAVGAFEPARSLRATGRIATPRRSRGAGLRARGHRRARRPRPRDGLAPARTDERRIEPQPLDRPDRRDRARGPAR